MNKIEEFNVDEFLDKVTETKKIFRQSLEKYGKEPQCRQTMEECAELIQAINKFLRYPNDKHYANLIEEIADVEIMLYQLKVMFNIDDDQVLAFKVEKAKREQERLEKLWAREMFIKLGYEYSFDTFTLGGTSHFISYKKKRGYEHIVFNLKNKTVKSSAALTIDEIKAVYQQCKELDWIEENAR